MPSNTPNLGLVTWTTVDQFLDTELAGNFSNLDTAVNDRLKKTGTDTLSGTVTITGQLNFGSSNTIVANQQTIVKGVGSYTALVLAGSVLIDSIASTTTTAFGVKTTLDSDNEASYRWRVNGGGKQYWGNGTAQDVAIYRESSPEAAIVAQIGSDLDTADPSMVLVAASKNKRYTGIAFRKRNYVWNGTGEIGTTDGWSTSALTGVTADATSITPNAGQFEVVTPATNNAGVIFTMYHKFRAGTQYTISASLSSAAATHNAQIGIGTTGASYAASTPAALTTSKVTHTATWTPVADVNEATFYMRQTAATAGTIKLDDVQVYEGSNALASNKQPLGETIPRWNMNAENLDVANQVQHFFAIQLERGMLVSEIGFLAGSTVGSGITAALAGLYSVAVADGLTPTHIYTWTKVAENTDMDFTYQGPHQAMVFPLASTYRVPTTGLYYISLLMNAITPVTLTGLTPSVATYLRGRGYNFFPLTGTQGTGLTALPSSYASSLTAYNSIPYAWVS